MTPYYKQGDITIYHGDCRDVLPRLACDATCLVIDPPYDDPDLILWANGLARHDAELVFTDPRHLGDIVGNWGPPVWVFTWDTMSPWSIGPTRPLTQTKFCLWYGGLDEYARDAVLWGPAPPRKNHPSTKQEPLNGRRLTDLWRESLRWLHHPSAGTGSVGVERFATKQGDPAFRYAKPVGWLRCLIGNTSAGAVLDPFMGSGTSLRAAKDLARAATGIDINERCCEIAAERLQQEMLPFTNREEAPIRDTGRYQSGYRIYRDGTEREDFGSDR